MRNKNGYIVDNDGAKMGRDEKDNGKDANLVGGEILFVLFPF